MTRTPAWVRGVSAVITIAVVVAAPPQRRPSSAVAVLDPFTTPAYVVSEINDSGGTAFCRVEADRWRPGQPDSARLAPAAARPAHPSITRISIVDSVTWPLDPTRWRLTATVLGDRIALCAAKGFAGAVVSISDRAPADLVKVLRAQGQRWGVLVVLVHHPPTDPPAD